MPNRDNLGIVAIVAIFGIVVVIIYLVWKSSQVTTTASSPSLGNVVDSAVETVEHSSPAKHDYTFSERQTITSPTAGTISRKRVTIPMTGELLGVTVYPDAVDDGDYFKLEAGNRTLIDKMFVYAATSIEQDIEKPESLRKGENLMLLYYNAGATSKQVDWIFHMVI